MSGVLNVLLTHGLGRGGYVSYNSSFSVNSGTGSSDTVAGRSFTYYGWCPDYSISGHSNYLPDSVGMGSFASGTTPIGVNGLAVIGVYEASAADVATVDRVIVVFSGNVLPTVNSVTIAGTSRPFAPYMSVNTTPQGNTAWIGNLATGGTSLFGLSGVKTVVLT